VIVYFEPSVIVVGAVRLPTESTGRVDEFTATVSETVVYAWFPARSVTVRLTMYGFDCGESHIGRFAGTVPRGFDAIDFETLTVVFPLFVIDQLNHAIEPLCGSLEFVADRATYAVWLAPSTTPALETDFPAAFSTVATGSGFSVSRTRTTSLSFAW
jgi:hypothetical protein